MTMFLRTYIPGPPLGECIDRFWLCSDTPPHPPERILPSGTVELVINLSDDESGFTTPSTPTAFGDVPGWLSLDLTAAPSWSIRFSKVDVP